MGSITCSLVMLGIYTALPLFIHRRKNDIKERMSLFLFFPSSLEIKGGGKISAEVSLIKFEKCWRSWCKEVASVWKQTGCLFAVCRGKLFEMPDVWSYVVCEVQGSGREKWGGNSTVLLSGEEEGGEFIRKLCLLWWGIQPFATGRWGCAPDGGGEKNTVYV